MLPSTFGGWLHEMRTAEGASLRATGEQLGVSHEMVRRYELDLSPPTFEVVVAAAAHYHVNAWELLAYYAIVPHDTLINLGSHPLPDELPEPAVKGTS